MDVPSEGWGGVAMNDDCTMMVCIDNTHIFVQDIALQITVNGYAHDMKDPRFACFVSHDTFVVIDAGLWHSEDGDCMKARYKLKEFSVAGKHVRTLAFPKLLLGVAYYAPKNLLAVAMGEPPFDHFVVMDYATQEIQSFGKAKSATGIRFTSDGLFLVIAQWSEHSVNKYSVATGAFDSCVAKASFPSDILVHDNGSITIACCPWMYDSSKAKVINVGLDGKINFHGSPSTQGTLPVALATDGQSAFVKIKDGGLFMLPLHDAEATTGGVE